MTTNPAPTVANDWLGGFIKFPDGTYVRDPNGAVGEIGDGAIGTLAEPYLFGDFGYASTQLFNVYGAPYYDLGMKRWIPASPGQTAPDGRTYVTDTAVVSVATGMVRMVDAPPNFPSATNAMVWEFDGRYAYLSGGDGSAVLRLDVTTGTYTEVSQASGVEFVQNGYAWVGLNDTADSAPPSFPTVGKRWTLDGQAHDTLVQINLVTGATTTWLYRPGRNVELLGIDLDGKPIVSVANGPAFDPSHGTVLLLQAPADASTVIGSDLGVTRVQRDVGRLWLGTDNGLYVWTQSGGLKKVISSTQGLMPAGFCV